MRIRLAHTNLATCLRTCNSGLSIAPFFMDRLYRDVNEGVGISREGAEISSRTSLKQFKHH